jgi:RNA polymerase sigma factor (sigma-70 family)
MMTLRELKEMVEAVEGKKVTPKAAALLQSEIPIVVKEVINAETDIMVFANGYVLYRAGKHTTVFPLHSCEGYQYGSVTSASNVLQGDFFENENWYVRLILEGEDRIVANGEKHHEKYNDAFHDYEEDMGAMADEKQDFERKLMEKELIDEALSLVDDKAARVIRDYYGNGYKQYEIGAEIQMDCKAVSKLIHRNLAKIRKSICVVDGECFIKVKK